MDILERVKRGERDYINSEGKAPTYLILDVYSYVDLCAALAREEVQTYEGLMVSTLVDEGQNLIAFG